ncbi:MAG TPA: YcxB family protein [Phycisphaerae bacterium]|nr:YcxB family protein [Phycisphaerae bacterium]
MEEALEIPIHYQPQDLQDAWKLTPKGIVWRVLGSLFGGFAAVWLAVLIGWLVEWFPTLASAGGNIQLYIHAAMSLGIASVGVAAIAALFAVLFWHTWKTSNLKTIARFQSDDARIMRIAESGLAMHGRFSETQYAWSCVKGLKESGGTLLIELKHEQLLLLPKRDLSPTAQTRATELISRHSRRPGPPAPLVHDAGEIFWHGEITYTREDIAASTTTPKKKAAPAGAPRTEPADPANAKKESKQKTRRSLLGWILIFAASILLYVTLSNPTPAVPFPPGPAPRTDDHHPGFMLAISTAASIAWIFAWTKLFQAWQWRRIRADAAKPRHLAIGTMGIVITHPVTREWHSWSAIVDVEPYPDGLILVTADESRLAIPLRTTDPAHRQSLADFARTQMGGKALGFEVIQPQISQIPNLKS